MSKQKDNGNGKVATAATDSAPVQELEERKPPEAQVPAQEAAESAAPPETQDVTGEPPVEVTVSQPSLAEMEARLAEGTDKYLRARAEFDNYRKRMQRELAELRDQEKLQIVQEFLAVYDCLQMANDHAKEDTNLQALKEGMAMISSEFARVLGNMGVTPMQPPPGDPFDPNIHEAIAQAPSATVPTGHVAQVWKCGFRLGERLVRPAVVVVSSGEPEPAKDQESKTA